MCTISTLYNLRKQNFVGSAAVQICPKNNKLFSTKASASAIVRVHRETEGSDIPCDDATTV